MPARTLWVLVYHLINSKNIKNFAQILPYFIFHSSDKSLLSPELTSGHLQEATKSFQFLIPTPFARKHIKPEDFDNATTYQLQQKNSLTVAILYIPHLKF